jgi:serine/threonine protein kinase
MLGTTLADRYRIISIVGQGGMSVVYKAHHELMKRMVAIKMLHTKQMQDEESVARFQQEAQAASQLNHVNVITVHDFGVSEDGRHYLVMDFVEGDSLAEILDESGPLPYTRAIPIFIQVCEGLGHAHENGIIHRDLKPGNIMVVQRDGRDLVKVVDFGVAKMLPRKGKPMQQLTHTGEIFGTSLYLSPEQCAGKLLDTRSDIYAFGCVMHEVLTAVPPFVGINLLDTMQKHINEPVPTFAQTAPELAIPPRLEQIVMKALAKLPEDRYQTMEELRSDLEQIDSTVPPVTAVSAKKRNLVVPILASVVVAIVAAGVLFFVNQKPAAVTQPAPDVAWRRFNDAGQKAYDQAKYDEAEKQFNLALRESQKFGDTDQHHILSLRRISDVYYITGKEKEADQIDEQVQQLKQKAKAEKENESASSDRIAALAQLCHKEGQCDTAERLLKRSLKVVEDEYGRDSVQTAERLNDLAVFYMSMGDYDKAKPLMSRVMQIKKGH